MKEFDINDTGVKIDVVAIGWPANATALVYEGTDQTLVCRTTDQDESKDSATTSEIRITCKTGQVIGTSLTVSRNDPIRMRSHETFLFAFHFAFLFSSFCYFSPSFLPCHR